MKANKLAVLLIAYAVTSGALIFAFSSPLNIAAPQQGINSFSSTSTSYGNLVILQNGTISNTSAPISGPVNGVYTLTGNMAGSITIERSNITLKGNGYSIDNQSVENGFGIMLNSVNNVTITNVEITNLSAVDYSSQTKGVYLYHSDNNTITSVHVSGGVFGIKLDASNHNVLNGNVASGSLYGAYICEGSLQNQVYGNDFSYSINDGIYLCTSLNSSIYGNNFSHSNMRGLYVGNSSNDDIYDNNASFTAWGIYLDYQSNSNGIHDNNFSSSGTGIYMVNGYNTTFSANNIANTINHAIEINNSKNSVISSNDLSNGNVGISLSYSSNFQIYGNSMNGNTYALNISNSQQNSVFNNDLSGSGNGATLANSPNNAIYNNTANSISGKAFSLDSSKGNTLSYNTISASEYGVYLFSSSNTVFFKNIIEDGAYALYLSNSQHNQIYNNSISGNSNYAFTMLISSDNNSFYGNYVFTDTYSFHISDSSWNLFYHNNFIINGSQFDICPCSTNYWDNGYPIGGNYWSNYTGYDNFSGPAQNLPGSDSIGDHPYNLTPKNIDHYPLMGMWINHFAIFTATGLAADTEWSVTFNSLTLSTVENQIVFDIPSNVPANYVFTVGNTLMFEAYPSSGTVDFTGSDVSIQIMFTSLYNVSFAEAGLSSGTQWTVTLGGNAISSSTGYVNFSVPNGTYDYTIHGVGGYFSSSYTGKAIVNGSTVTIPVIWNVYNYTVTFMETGLPSGTQWSTTFNNVTKSSAASMQFSAPNGTYSYSVSPIAGYYVSSYTNSVGVEGSNVQVTIAWQEFKYSVIFSSSGLPVGQSWAVTLGSVPQTSTSNNIGFSMPNGTYDFTISAISGYHASIYSGTTTVNGNNIETSISWVQIKYQVTFDQTGLPSGAEWWVNLTGGDSYRSTASSLTIDLPNGTYGYTASAGGYTSTPSSGNVSVSGAPPGNIAINFTKQETTSGGVPVWYWYIIGGVIAIAGAFGLGLYVSRRAKSP